MGLALKRAACSPNTKNSLQVFNMNSGLPCSAHHCHSFLVPKPWDCSMSPYAWPCSAPCLWKAQGELKAGCRQQQTGLGATSTQGRSWAWSFSWRKLTETPGGAIFRGTGLCSGLGVSVWSCCAITAGGLHCTVRRALHPSMQLRLEGHRKCLLVFLAALLQRLIFIPVLQLESRGTEGSDCL